MRDTQKNKIQIVLAILIVLLFIRFVYSQIGPTVGINPPSDQYHHISEIWINDSIVDWRGLEFTNIYRIYTDRISPYSATGISVEGHNLLTMTPYLDNALGFRSPYRVERWTGSTWIDITNSTDWRLITDGKPSTGINLIDFGYTSDRVRIRLYYDFGGNWVTPAQLLVLYLQHIPTINYLKVEQADDPNFTTNVEILKEVTSPIGCFDCTRVIPTSTFWRRYLRIEIDVSRPSGTTWNLVVREIAYYSPAFYSGSRLLSSMIPIDWDQNRNIFISNNLGIGTTNPQARLHVSGDTRIDGSLQILGQIVISSGRVLQNIANVATNLIPSADNTYDLGSSTNRWRNIFAVNITTTTLCLGTDCRSSWPTLTETDPLWTGNITPIGANYLIRRTSTGIGQSVIYDTGTNVGIGTTNPQYTLDVAGTLRLQDLFPAGGQNLIIGDDVYLTDIDMANTLGIYGLQDSTRANIKLGSNGPTISGYNNNLGINTVSPAATLHVSGDTRIDGSLQILGQIVISSGRVLQNIANVATNLIPSADNTYDLGSSTNRWRNIFANTVNTATLCLGGDCRTSWPTGGGGTIDGSGSPGQVAFWTGTSTIAGDNNLFWDNTNKRLGIGTTNPQARLHVSGDTRINGNIFANAFYGNQIYDNNNNLRIEFDTANRNVIIRIG